MALKRKPTALAVVMVVAGCGTIALGISLSVGIPAGLIAVGVPLLIFGLLAVEVTP